MSSLPPALAPWRRPLSLLPRELALGLGPLVQRLDQVVGPLRPARRADTGELDGFDGLARRGTPERLLMGEWLLAEALPEEFLRRAAMGEQAFLHPARREPGRTRRSVALFDAGPGQLGGPRLAQLALLVVLAARAEAAGVRLAWGLLQAPDRLREDVTEAGLLAFLEGRTAREPSAADLEAWAGALAREGAGGRGEDDLWVAGAAPGALPGASTVTLGDVLEPGVLAVEAVVRRAGAAPRRAVLALPPRAPTVRLLRDPRRESLAAPAAGDERFDGPLPDPGSPPLLAPDGSLVLVRLTDGSLAAHRLPGSPRARAGRSFRIGPRGRGRVVGAGHASGSRWVAATSPDHELLEVWRVGKRGQRTQTELARWERSEPPEVPLWPIFPGPDGRGLDLLLLPGTRLRQLRLGPVRDSILRAVGPPVVWAAAADPRSGRLVAFAQDAPGSPLGGLLSTAGRRDAEPGWSLEAQLQAPEPWRCFLGEGRHLAHRRFNLGALRVGPGRYRLLGRWDDGGDGTVEVPPAMEPCGVAVENGASAPSLVALEADRRTVVLLKARPGRMPRARVVLSTCSPIAQVVTAPGPPLIALHTTGGEVVVYSLKYETVVRRILHQEAR